MATALVTLTWCDKHLAEKDEEVPAVPMPEWSGLNVDLCEKCAEPILVARALYTDYGSKGQRTPKPPRRRNARAAVATPEAATDPPHVCPECGNTLGFRHTLVQHVRNVHGKYLLEMEGKPLPYECDTCGRRVPTPGALALHQKAHQ